MTDQETTHNVDAKTLSCDREVLLDCQCVSRGRDITQTQCHHDIGVRKCLRRPIVLNFIQV